MQRLPIEIGQRLSVDSASKASYRVIQCHGTGGNCEVYLVTALDGARRGALVALKVFFNTANEERLKRFMQEGEILAGLDHPAVLRVHESGTVRIPSSNGMNESPCTISTFWPSTLAGVSAGRLRLLDKVIYAIQLVSALRYLSAKNLLHRDIKPKNILINGPTCALADFGLVKVLGSTDEPATTTLLEESLEPGINKSYPSPDLVDYIQRGTPLTLKSDLFQLGLVLGELFTGHNPCQKRRDKTSPVVLESLDQIPGKHGKRIHPIISRMLVAEADKRETVDELFDSWEGVLQEVARDQHELEGRAV